MDADSKLAMMTIEHLTKKSEEDQQGLVHIPESFSGMEGVEKTDTGAGYSLRWLKDVE